LENAEKAWLIIINLGIINEKGIASSANRSPNGTALAKEPAKRPRTTWAGTSASAFPSW